MSLYSQSFLKESIFGGLFDQRHNPLVRDDLDGGVTLPLLQFRVGGSALAHGGGQALGLQHADRVANAPQKPVTDSVSWEGWQFKALLTNIIANYENLPVNKSLPCFNSLSICRVLNSAPVVPPEILESVPTPDVVAE